MKVYATQNNGSKSVLTNSDIMLYFKYFSVTKKVKKTQRVKKKPKKNKRKSN